MGEKVADRILADIGVPVLREVSLGHEAMVFRGSAGLKIKVQTAGHKGWLYIVPAEESGTYQVRLVNDRENVVSGYIRAEASSLPGLISAIASDGLMASFVQPKSARA